MPSFFLNRDPPVNKDREAPQELKELVVVMVLMASVGLKVLQVPMGRMVLLECQDFMEQKVKQIASEMA